jgi:Dyp-type peroxidase family
MIVEPEIELDEIQGNIVPGFKKDHQHFLFFRIESVPTARSFLARLASQIWTARQVLIAHDLWKALRAARGVEPTDVAMTMLNVALSWRGLAQLVPAADLERFDDDGFAVGQAERAGDIGDPTAAGEAGSPSTWLFGNAAKPVDLVVIIASDDHDWLRTEADALIIDATDSGLVLVHRDEGRVRPGGEAGHEPFGFKDSISEPAIRGRWPGQDRFVVPRSLPAAAAFDDLRKAFAAPGRALIYPGHFLFGYEQQDADDPEKPIPARQGPAWSKNGSFLVYRRLRQRPAAFTQFLEQTAHDLAATIPGVDAAWVGSRMVGRWKSGTPVMRSPNRDIGVEDPADNYFTFRTATTLALPGDTAPLNPADPVGDICPVGAHIRKVNPRDDDPTDLGVAMRALKKLIIRRGIPFDETATNPDDVGLLFVAYQSSIQDQFEFLMRSWVNQPERPRPAAGFDPILGATAGRQVKLRVDGRDVPIALPTRFVVASAGEYFFAPSLTALKMMSASP